MSGQNNKPERVYGRPFKPGQSGNPGGFRKEKREELITVKEKLDRAFTTGPDGKPLPDGRDLLIEAIVAGVALRDQTCLKLASDRRWGKVPIAVTGADGGPIQVQQLPFAELIQKAQARRG